MEFIFLIIAIVGLIFAYFELVVPFVKGEVKISKKFPFVTSTKRTPSEEKKPLLEKEPEIKGKKAKLFAVMFTDIKGYTACKLKNESRALEMLEEYKKLVRSIFSKHDGTEIKMKGDEFLVQFDSAVDAAACALEIQKTLNEHNASQPEESKINVRIGVHVGPVIHRKKELFGSGVDIASQIGPFAKPGGIYITEDVFRTVRSKLEAPINKVSKSELEQIQTPMNIYSIVMPWEEAKRPSVEKEQVERIKIAVADFVNETGEKELDGLSGMLITALEQSRYLTVLTRPGMLDVLKQMGKEDVDRIDEVLGREIGRKANLNALAIASVRKFGGIYTTDLKVLDPQKDEYMFTASVEGRGQECIPAVIDNISQKTRIGLEEKRSEIQATSQSVADITTVNLEAYQHYFQGEELINKLKFKEAQEEFKQAIELDSSFGLAYYRLAYAVDWERNEQLAKEYIQKALSLIERIPDKEKYLVRALNANIEESFEAGIEILKEMEQFYPDDKEMMYNIGDWSFHSKRYTTTIDYLEKVLAMDPTHDRALEHLTWTYREMEKYEKMLEYSKRYVSVTGSAESYNLLGDAYALLGDFETGLKTLQQARELFPNRYFISGSIADLYTCQGQYDKALAELKKLIAANQPPEVKQSGYQRLVWFYPYIGKYQDTIMVLDKIIEHSLQVNDVEKTCLYRITKGLRILWGRNDIENAWNEAEKTFPFHNRIVSQLYWSALSLLYVYHGDYGLAESRAKSSGVNWWYSVIMSLIHSTRHECAKAESFADKALETVVGSIKTLILYPLAQCQFESGQLDNAKESLLRLHTVDDNSYGFRAVFYPKSFYLLGKIYMKQGKKKLAIENYEKFLELWKEADEDLPDLIDAKKRLAALKTKK